MDFRTGQSADNFLLLGKAVVSLCILQQRQRIVVARAAGLSLMASTAQTTTHPCDSRKCQYEQLHTDVPDLS